MAGVDIKPDFQGKVRDLYDLGDKLLFVASDRISAFDYILPDEIPAKGEVLTRLSCFWFEFLEDVCGNHMISADVADLPEQFKPYADYLKGRFMLVKKAEMFPAECIVRGYLTGSGWKEYKFLGTVGSMELPMFMKQSQKFLHPLLTPSTKAEVGEHDVNISFKDFCELLGDKDAREIRDYSLKIYEKASEYAAGRGIIIADTKFEFGRVDGQIILADEVLTPDSSRFWPADLYEVGKDQPSFDKQYVRDWLSANWDKQGEPPHLPQEVIEKTTEKYIQAYEKITGRKF
ncbi:MAG: phosphoribosylaminoimidazolesuccinocarboxamide synthase [Eggerthellales bacterium]|nr:phosphoribosylaminoimidazolesuccinocarboxamide synthase [Eggerthellales bacterium]